MTLLDHANRPSAWCRSLPKVELHVHLEGAIPLTALQELARKYVSTGSPPTLAEFEKRFRYRDFAHFLETWTWKNGFLRELDDFTFIAGSVARHLQTQNLRYAEAFFSPTDFACHGLAVGDIARAVRGGLDTVPGIRVNLIADLVRDLGHESAARTLAEVAEVRDLGVVGIGIGGSEAEYPPQPFAPVFEKARAFGFRTSAHAGEAAGPESVRGALHALRVDRLGHGTRAGEDPALVEELARTRVPVEMCPISNVRTGVVRGLEDHPVRSFMDAGVLVTVNSDDPAMFQTSLAGEYTQLIDVLGFSRREILGLIDNAVNASWLEEDRKRELRSELHGDPAWGA